MSLTALQATPHPAGNRIDLRWQIAVGSAYDGVRVVRRRDTFPKHADDGVLVPIDPAGDRASDTDLPELQTYYYTVFPYLGSPPVYQFDRRHRVSAVATANAGFARYLMTHIPAIYQRYDRDTQLLQRFLQVVGGQFDVLHSFAAMTTQLRNVRLSPGHLLPLLADWIAWKTDYSRELDAQRGEIRSAPQVYQRMGLLPTVASTVKRISGWESRSKEFVHNIFSSNRPPLLNLWALQRDAGGVWQTGETLVSLDANHDGRVSTVRDQHNIRFVVYHTERQNSWELWLKTTRSVLLPLSLSDEVQAGTISPLLHAAIALALQGHNTSLAQTAVLIALAPQVWQVDDGVHQWVLEQQNVRLQLFLTQSAAEEMPLLLGESEALVAHPHDDGTLDKYPGLGQHGNRLWLFWSRYTSATAQWQIHFRYRREAQWSATGPAGLTVADNPFAALGIYDATIPRRYPVLATDSSDNLWLFWCEWRAQRWQLRYNRRQAGNWGEAQSFPLDAGEDPRVLHDLNLCIDSGNSRIYVFWSRPALSGSGVARMQIAYRVKRDVNLDEANWDPVRSLPKSAVDEEHDDREAFAHLLTGDVEVFFSSNREDSGWSVWRATLDDALTNSWSDLARVSAAVDTQRAPVAIQAADTTVLLIGNNRRLEYRSEFYRATTTYDHRYAGHCTLHTRYQQQLLQHRRFDDALGYTYDTGINGQRDDSDWIARDTLGCYLATNTLSSTEVTAGVQRLRPVLREFMPLTDRAVMITESDVHSEAIYYYDFTPSVNSHYIVSEFTDDWLSSASENALAADEDFNSTLDENTV